MDGYNLFEPDLELDVNTIPYEDMGIQGVWPRKQRTPSDVFPANANLVARGEDNKARWCKADKDGILYTHDIASAGGSVGPTVIINGSGNFPSRSGDARLVETEPGLKTLHVIHYSMCLSGTGTINAQNQVRCLFSGLFNGFVDEYFFSVVYPDEAPVGYQMQSQVTNTIEFPNGGYTLAPELQNDPGGIDIRIENSIGVPVWMFVLFFFGV